MRKCATRALMLHIPGIGFPISKHKHEQVALHTRGCRVFCFAQHYALGRRPSATGSLFCFVDLEDPEPFLVPRILKRLNCLSCQGKE